MAAMLLDLSIIIIDYYCISVRLLQQLLNDHLFGTTIQFAIVGCLPLVVSRGLDKCWLLVEAWISVGC